MSLGILRNWKCQNPRCRKTFTHGQMNPKCPNCGSIRTQWIPGGFNIGNQAKNVDRIVKDLAASYGMTDIPTVSAGEAVKKAKWRKDVGKAAGVEVANPTTSGDWRKTGISGTVQNFRTGSKLSSGGTAQLPMGNTNYLRQHRTKVVAKYDGNP